MTPFHLRHYYTYYAVTSLIFGLSTTGFALITHLFLVFAPLTRRNEYAPVTPLSPQLLYSIAIIDLIPNILWLLTKPANATLATFALLASLLLYSLPLVIFARLASKMLKNQLAHKIPPITLQPSTWQWCKYLIANLIFLAVVIAFITFSIIAFDDLWQQGELLMMLFIDLLLIMIYLGQTALLIADIKYARQARQNKQPSKITIIEISKYLSLIYTRTTLILLTLWIITILLAFIIYLPFAQFDHEFFLQAARAAIFITLMTFGIYLYYRFASEDILCYNPRTQEFFLRHYTALSKYPQNETYLARPDIAALVIRYRYRINSYDLVIVPKDPKPPYYRAHYTPNPYPYNPNDPRKEEYRCTCNSRINNARHTTAPRGYYLWHIRRIAWRSGLPIKIEYIDDNP